MKRILYFIYTILVFGFFSCEKEIDPGLAPNSKLAGQWTVKEYDLDMNEFLDQGGNPYAPYNLLTYNTANDQDSIWIDNIYGSGIKMKAHVLSGTSFDCLHGIDINNVLFNDYDVTTISISEASIIGDSIIFRVTLFDSGGAIFDDYYEAGHMTTGWDDDSY